MMVGMVLFGCDQCAYEEWRDATQEPWLCPVCGGMRWTRVATGDLAEGAGGEAPGSDPRDPSDE